MRSAAALRGEVFSFDSFSSSSLFIVGTSAGGGGGGATFGLAATCIILVFTCCLPLHVLVQQPSNPDALLMLDVGHCQAFGVCLARSLGDQATTSTVLPVV